MLKDNSYASVAISTRPQDRGTTGQSRVSRGTRLPGGTSRSRLGAKQITSAVILNKYFIYLQSNLTLTVRKANLTTYPQHIINLTLIYIPEYFSG